VDEASDTVTVGAPTPQGGTLANLLGALLTISTNTSTQTVTLTLDDSGDQTTTARRRMQYQGSATRRSKSWIS
jgi:hypothetical protein